MKHGPVRQAEANITRYGVRSMQANEACARWFERQGLVFLDFAVRTQTQTHTSTHTHKHAQAHTHTHARTLLHFPTPFCFRGIKDPKEKEEAQLAAFEKLKVKLAKLNEMVVSEVKLTGSFILEQHLARFE